MWIHIDIQIMACVNQNCMFIKTDLNDKKDLGIPGTLMWQTITLPPERHLRGVVWWKCYAFVLASYAYRNIIFSVFFIIYLEVFTMEMRPYEASLIV